MEKKQSLFREEVLSNRLNRSLGTLRVNVPLNFRITSFFCLLILLTVASFLFFAQTEEKIEVRGFLDTEQGLITIYSDLKGQIIHSNAEEGRTVKKGETLFYIANSSDSHSKALMENLKQRLANLKREYALKQENYHAITKLYAKHYVAAALVKETETALLELSNKIKLVDLELIQYHKGQSQQIKSTVDGVITNIFYKQGQTAEPTKALLQILPKNSQLIARLYIPSRDIGFVNKGDKVLLKYDAYPASRFGVYPALIKEINLTVLTDEQEDKPIKLGQPYYKIKANLARPFVKLYGKEVMLNHGMTVTAVIKGDRKQVWKWILDPVYSFYGEIFS